MADAFLICLVFSPLVALFFVCAMVLLARQHGRAKPSLWRLSAYTALYALVGAALTVAGLIWWMRGYEASTSFGAGNAPVGLIFLLPVAIAVGQIVAFMHWWLGKPD